MPDETAQAADDLRARAVLPGHAGRFVLAKHSWDEPYQRLAASEGRSLASADACAGRAGGSPIRRNHLTPSGAKAVQYQRREHMTISAQVIDTIVRWIDDNLHQPLRIDSIARHAGYSKWHLQRLFLPVQRESLGRYIRERKLLLAARDLATPISGSTISASSMALIRKQTFTRVFTRPSISRGRLPQREPQSRPLRRASPGLTLEGKPATPHPAQHQILNGAQRQEPQTKQHRIELVEIHHMECLNQLLRQRQAQRRRGQQQTGEQGQQ